MSLPISPLHSNLGLYHCQFTCTLLALPNLRQGDVNLHTVLMALPQEWLVACKQGRYQRFFSAGAPQRPVEEVEVPLTAANPDGTEGNSAAAMREEVRCKRREYKRSRVF